MAEVALALSCEASGATDDAAALLAARRGRRGEAQRNEADVACEASGQ